MLKLGIVGKGFVGGSVSFGFDKDVEQIIVDPVHSVTTLVECVNKKPDGIFICVPSPESESGDVDVSIAESVLDQLHELKYDGIVIIKSTISPGHLKQFKEKYSLRIVYNPEFLTEAAAHKDFINPPMQILGGEWEDCEKVEKMYVHHTSVRIVPTFKTDIVSASLIKYTLNCFLATKVIWMNELQKIHEASGAETSWEQLTDMISRDPRVGQTHHSVPGPDGFYGFGGHCFPKDTAAFLYYAKDLGVDMSVLEAAINKNKEIRNES